MAGEGTLIAGNNMHAFQSGEIYILGADQPHLFKSSPEYFQPGKTKKAVKALTIFDPDGSLSSMFDLPEMKAFKDFIQHQQQGFKLPAAYVDEVSRSMLDIQNTSGARPNDPFFANAEDFAGNAGQT